MQRWLDSGLFHPEAEGTAGRELLDRDPAAERHRRAAHGPRAQRLDPGRAHPLRTGCAGAHARWILGTDHAGIATQTQVEKRLRRGGHLAARSSAARRSSSGSGSGASSTAAQIIEQFKRLGASCDYERERFTLDEGYVRAVLKVFVDLYDEGLHLPRQLHGQLGPGHAARRSPTSRSRTARSTDTLYTIDYPLEDGDGEVVVATVRPETMLADTAVAVNPDDERYAHLVGRHRDPAARRAAAADHRRRVRQDRVRHRRAEDHARATTPTTSRSAAATGSSEITRHRRGRAHDRGGRRAFAGLTVAEARERVVADAARAGAAARRGALHAHGPVLAPLRRADRAADLAAVVHAHGRAGARRRSRRSRAAACGSTPSRSRGATSTGWRTSARGASPASSGGATSSRSGTAARRDATSGMDAAGGRGLGRATPTCSTPGSAARCGRSRRSAGPTRRPSCAPSTRPTCSRRRATSSSSGSRAW